MLSLEETFHEKLAELLIELFKTLLKAAAAQNLLIFPTKETFSAKQPSGWYSINHFLRCAPKSPNPST